MKAGTRTGRYPRAAAVAWLLVLGAAAGARPAFAIQRVAARDTVCTMPGGTTFTVPEGWSFIVDGRIARLEPPEGGSRIWIVETTALEPDSAIASAWRQVRPGFSRPLRLTTPQPGRNGWDEAIGHEYATSPNERRLIGASALRHETAWTVTLGDLELATLEKRSSQFRHMFETLRPAGYVQESFAGRTAHALDADRVASLTAFLENGMRELGIPGAALSIVQNDGIVFEGGFGVRELGKPARVDADTRFLVASITKPLTTLLLARLVDAGKIDWDTPVLDVYPDFRLGDSTTTRQVRIEHLVCACTGLPRQDFEWFFQYGDAMPADAMRTLAGVQPTSAFGELFQYSNLMGAAAGFIAGHLLHPDMELGAAYDQAMHDLVFQPLGMKDATFDFSTAEQGNHARPHGYDVDGATEVASMDSNHSAEPVRPAAGLWATARDLIRYARLELARGTVPDGSRIVSEENILARRQAKVSAGETGHYGMGLELDHEWDVPVFGHDGSMFGYKSNLWILPEHGVGVVLLTNGDNGWRLLAPFYRRLIELLFDGRALAEEDLRAAAREWRTRLDEERKRLSVPADPVQAAKLARHYHNPALGDISVHRVGTRTVFDFGEWQSDVASRRNDDGTVSFQTIDPAVDGFEFVVVGESLVLRDSQHEYVFTPGAGE